jgi:hypothetical protein
MLRQLGLLQVKNQMGSCNGVVAFQILTDQKVADLWHQRCVAHGTNDGLRVCWPLHQYRLVDEYCCQALIHTR